MIVSAPGVAASAVAPAVSKPVVTVKLGGVRLRNVAQQVGLDFRQGSFRYGMSNDVGAMMGGGLCWLDYNNDGWEDLYVVNSYSDSDVTKWEANGGLPRNALFENVNGKFVDVSRGSGADLAVKGDGCVAADFNGDGYTDLLVTTTTGIKLLWNNGNGTFTEGAAAAGMTASGWYTGAAVADVNGDGRPDVFVAGYTDSTTRFRARPRASRRTTPACATCSISTRATARTAARASARSACRRGSSRRTSPTGSARCSRTTTATGGRISTWRTTRIRISCTRTCPGPAARLPTRRVSASASRSARQPRVSRTRYAGMGIVSADYNGDGRNDLFVTNSRREPSAAYVRLARPGAPAFANARPAFLPALGTSFAGWGASAVDLENSGKLDLVLAAGAIPDHEPGGGRGAGAPAREPPGNVARASGSAAPWLPSRAA